VVTEKLLPTGPGAEVAKFLPPRMSDRLSASLRTVRSENESDPAKILRATEFLIACGRTEEAGIGLRRSAQMLQVRGMRFSSLAILQSVNRRLEAARVHQRVVSLGELGARLFSSSEEVVMWTAPRPRTLLVVFGSMYGDVWLSYPVLQCLLPVETTSILYLKDPAAMMFLTGLSSFGPGFDALCAGIRALAAEHGLTDIRVMGYSSGGFGGLLAAAHIEATSYLGLSIRTDLDPQSALPKDRYVERADLRAAAGSLMIDLKPVLERAHPQRGILYYGAKSRIDEAHARHLAGVPDFTIQRMADSHHNTVIHLIAEGRFDGVIRRFLS
jgi:hypothetical protein